jgi:hypothetical protein
VGSHCHWIACLQVELQGVELLQGVESPDQYSTEATFKVHNIADQASDHSPGVPTRHTLKSSKAQMDILGEVVHGLLMPVVSICRSWAGSWTASKAFRRRLATMKSLARCVSMTMALSTDTIAYFMHACTCAALL